MLPIDDAPPAEVVPPASLEVLPEVLPEVLDEADAAAPDPDDEPLEEPTTSLESVDAVSQAARRKVAAHIVRRRFIMEIPIQIR